MNIFSKKIQNLIEEIHKLPTIGTKTAEKIAFSMISKSESELKSLSDAILDIKNIKLCKVCFNLSEDEYCSICLDKNRDSSVVCVVSDIKDIIPIERTSKFKGKYHITHGLLDPLNGINVEQTKIKELIERVEKNKDKIKEVIFGINPKIEGESTIMYITKELKNTEVKLTRFARGLPIGSEIEYADQTTLSDAITGRMEL